MLSEELSTDMDRITQLQDAILDLLTITSTSIEYITKKTQFEQASSLIPATLHTPQAADRKEYKENIGKLVQDLVRRAKDVQVLIEALPKKDDSTERAERLRQLQEEMGVANEAYVEATRQAEELQSELQQALGEALGDGTTMSLKAGGGEES
ncbi:mediator of RNA polymerase II transcription subunit 21, partial [Tremellales sp. Uapishka_1]